MRLLNKIKILLLIKFIVISNISFAAENELLKLRKNDHYLGNINAPIVMIEYSSVSCPHCANFHINIFKEFEKKYIQTSKVLYIYRDMPFNKPGLMGAILAHCTDQQYINYISILMNSQSMWIYSEDYEKSLTNIAKLGGFKESKIMACFKDQQSIDQLIKDSMDAIQTLKIDATPTYFINKKKYERPVTLQELSKYIDSLLKSQ